MKNGPDVALAFRFDSVMVRVDDGAAITAANEVTTQAAIKPKDIMGWREMRRG
jgi:hypothetical protein